MIKFVIEIVIAFVIQALNHNGRRPWLAGSVEFLHLWESECIPNTLQCSIIFLRTVQLAHSLQGLLHPAKAYRTRPVVGLVETAGLSNNLVLG